jgi:hypothetical protein
MQGNTLLTVIPLVGLAEPGTRVALLCAVHQVRPLGRGGRRGRLTNSARLLRPCWPIRYTICSS